MSLRFPDLWRLGRLTLADPRGGLRAVLASNPPPRARIEVLVLLAVLSALLLHLGLWIAPVPPGNPLVEALIGTPLTTAIAQTGGLLVMALLVHGLGRAWGGAGLLGDAVLTVAWLQAMLVALQAVQLLALVVLPPLAPILSLMSLGLFFWLLTQFVTELHGFASPVRVFLGILVAFLALSFLMAALLAASFGPEAFADV